MAKKCTFKMLTCTSSQIPASLAQGEPLWVTDTQQLYIGTGTGVVPIEGSFIYVRDDDRYAGEYEKIKGDTNGVLIVEDHLNIGTFHLLRLATSFENTRNPAEYSCFYANENGSFTGWRATIENDSPYGMEVSYIESYPVKANTSETPTSALSNIKVGDTVFSIPTAQVTKVNGKTGEVTLYADDIKMSDDTEETLLDGFVKVQNTGSFRIMVGDLDLSGYADGEDISPLYWAGDKMAGCQNGISTTGATKRSATGMWLLNWGGALAAIAVLQNGVETTLVVNGRAIPSGEPFQMTTQKFDGTAVTYEVDWYYNATAKTLWVYAYGSDVVNISLMEM